jgi:glyoxylase-like metal-dependent hydrolase (beta-lactamase superfamily II)
MFTTKTCSLGAALVLVAAAVPAFAAETDFDAVQITATPVAGKITMLQGNGGNIAVSLGTDGVLMVDDQFAPLSEKITAAITKLGGGAPHFLLNTHWHGDHSGGNENFADTATIIAQDNVRVRLADPANTREDAALPVITYATGLSIHYNGEEIKLIHLPHGHTDGDSAVWFTGSNVIHMGDEYVTNGFPFIDLDSGGSVEGLIDNLTRILAQLPDDIRIIPGHGELSTKGAMSAWIEGVRASAKIITDQMAAGKSLAAIIQQGLPDQYDSWGMGFINEAAYITAVYTSSSNP